MGTEFGQFKEWDYKEGIEFFLKKYPMHEKLSRAIQDLNFFYLNTPAFYEIEDSWDGFEWLAPNDADRNFIAYIRKDRQGNQIVVIVNFSGIALTNYTLGIAKGKYKLIFNTDSVKYGGSGTLKKRIYTTTKTPSHGKEYSIRMETDLRLFDKNRLILFQGVSYAQKKRMCSHAFGGWTGQQIICTYQ